MIDWINLAANTLWILACALGLAGLSQAAWSSRLGGIRLRRQMQAPAYQRLFPLAGVLFCTGLAATPDAAWEQAIWALLALAFLIQLALAWRALPRASGSKDH